MLRQKWQEKWFFFIFVHTFYPEHTFCLLYKYTNIHFESGQSCGGAKKTIEIPKTQQKKKKITQNFHTLIGHI